MLMGAHAAPLVRVPTTGLTSLVSTRRTTIGTINRRIIINRTNNSTTLVVHLLLIFLLSSGAAAQSSPESNAQALLKFKSSLANADEALANWKPSTNPCPVGRPGGWNGVLCSDEGNVWGLKLENLSLSGQIDVVSLVPLALLRTISFMNNQFEGPIPDFRKLGALKALYLSGNQFSGPIADDAFEGMASLKKLHMANNKFTGDIPTSMAAPRLLELNLENNKFVGRMPDFPRSLKVFNVSNNQLDGPIPPTVKTMDPTSFSGNKDLCGQPLDLVCNSSPTSPRPAELANPPISNPPGNPPLDHNAKKSSLSSPPLRVVAIVIACFVALAAILVLCIVYYRRSRQTPQLGWSMSSSKSYKQMEATVAAAASSNMQVGAGGGNNASSMTSSTTAVENNSNKAGPIRKAEHGRLSFVRDDRQRFELQDLLRASAEVLGSGSFGSSYKAVLMDGQAVVVKRFKQMSNVGREEFHEHMRRLGRLKHPNLLPLVAYYYRKEEKLLVFDYVHNGSLARQLHGNHTVDKPGLDWPTRLKIIKGVAKGLSYLYSELPSLIVPHGHLKSSNVLLDKSFEPLLMDYTLVPVVNLEQAHQLLVAYKSPEYAQHCRTTKKTDVWSLGILILELLTGQFPVANYLAQGKGASYGADLASWVNYIATEESTQVLDKEMGSTNNSQGEMIKLLKIGVYCCEEDLEIRLDLKEAVEKIELLKERDSDGDDDDDDDQYHSHYGKVDL